MGWTYRKSVGLGPFQINISKSGIGYSVGGAALYFTHPNCYVPVCLDGISG